MRLSDRLQSLADYFSPEEMFHSRALVLEAVALAKRYEDAPVLTVERVNAAGIRWNGVDVTDYADYGQRVRIVLDKEGV